MLQAEKAGHAGTLDPDGHGHAAAVLRPGHQGLRPAARQAQGVPRHDPARRVDRHRGCRRRTLVAAPPCPRSTAADIERSMQELRGARTQVPPMYSALKRDGRPLYELARQGVMVEREARAITIEQPRTGRAPDVAHARDRRRLLQGHLYPRARRGTRRGTRHAGPPECAAAAVGRAVRGGTHGHAGHRSRRRRDDAAADGTTADPRGQCLPGWLQPVDVAFPDLPALRLDASGSLHLRQGRVLAAPADCPRRRTCASTTSTGVFSDSSKSPPIARSGSSDCSSPGPARRSDAEPLSRRASSG